MTPIQTLAGAMTSVLVFAACGSGPQDHPSSFPADSASRPSRANSGEASPQTESGAREIAVSVTPPATDPTGIGGEEKPLHEPAVERPATADTTVDPSSLATIEPQGPTSGLDIPSFDSGTGAQTLNLGDPALFTAVQSQTDEACEDFTAPSKIELRVVDNDGLLTCDRSRVDVDVCAGKGEAISFRYQSSELAFWIKFDPALALAPVTAERLRALFLSFRYQISLPANNLEGRPFISEVVNGTSLQDFDLLAFEDGRLKAHLSTLLHRMTRWVAPKSNCVDSDVPPLTCQCQYHVELPVAIDLDLIFPESTALKTHSEP